MKSRLPLKRQAGLTYVEVMVAAVLLVLALVPAVEALYTGLLGSRAFDTSSREHYATLARFEEVLAESYGALLVAAATAGSQSTPSSYSDAAGPPDRLLVYVALYDANDADGDGDVFTVLDENLDGDNDPYTGYAGLLWIRVAVENSVTGLESLAAP